MITTDDLISRPYTPDLTQAGIDYVHHSASHIQIQTKHLQGIISGVAIELAFRRFLGELNVPHINIHATPFTNPDRYYIAIGGRRCEIKSSFIYQKKRIQAIIKNPARLLKEVARIPVDEMKDSNLTDDGIYIFSVLTALTTYNQKKLQQAYQVNQPIHLVHGTPKAWADPFHSASLGEIALKSNASDPIMIQLMGQGRNNIRLHEQIMLRPHQRTAVQNNFYALHYLFTEDFPSDEIGFYSPTLKNTHIIETTQWENIWVYGMKVFFTGYITRGEFRRRGQVLSGSRTAQYGNVQTQNLVISTQELHPIFDLFERAKVWQRARK